MSAIPIVTITFRELYADGRVVVTVTSVSGSQISANLRLPFPLERTPELLRALTARQGVHYSENRLFRDSDERAELIAFLRSLGLWEGGDDDGVVVASVREQVGALLGDTLFADIRLRECLQTLHEIALEAGQGELVLQFSQTVLGLAALPWELVQRDGRPLLITGGVLLNCVRILVAGEGAPTPRASGSQLHILALVPRAGMNDRMRAAERQARAALASSFGTLQVTIEELRPATMLRLRQRLEQGPAVDVIDFCGHGRVDKVGGKLLFDDEFNLGDWVSADRLAALPNLPPLFVLQACDSAWLDVSDPFSGVAAALSKAEVRAVVAMQAINYALSNATTLIPTLYSQLFAGRSIQRAMAEVRRALYNDRVITDDWHVPVLYLRQADARPYRLLEPRPNPFAGTGALDNVELFVGREQSLRRLWERLEAGSNLSIIGPPGSGKSSLLHCVASQARERLIRKVRPGQTVEVVSLAMFRELKLPQIQTELAVALGGRQKTELSRLLRKHLLILLLDDISQLNGDERGRDVRQWLRGLASNRTTASVQIVATSQRPLHEIFVNDKADDASPLHDALRDHITLGPFSQVEARQFIARRLVETPFNEMEFADALTGSLIPGAIQDACRARYDELYQRWE